MTRIKLCGLSRPADAEAVNELMPEYAGFILVPGRKRCISPEQAAELKSLLRPEIKAVGVFIDESPDQVAELLKRGIIDLAQLHGGEDESYISRLRMLTDRPLIKAFRIDSAEDLRRAAECTADYVLLDSGIGGTGKAFDWNLLRKREGSPGECSPGECPLKESSTGKCSPKEEKGLASVWAKLSRTCFLAGGLTAENVKDAIEAFHPFGVDVSSGIETGGVKDRGKMRAFVRQARSAR